METYLMDYSEKEMKKKGNGIEEVFEEKMAEFFQNWCKSKSTGQKTQQTTNKINTKLPGLQHSKTA